MRGGEKRQARGFDGVECTPPTAILIDQFLRDGSTSATTSTAARSRTAPRFALEIVDAVLRSGRSASAFASPGEPANDIRSNPAALFGHLVLAQRTGSAYLHVVEGRGGRSHIAPFDYTALRRAFSGGAYMANNGNTRELANEPWRGIAPTSSRSAGLYLQPHLVERLRLGAALAEIDRATLYAACAKGYTDYPALADA